MMGIKWDEMGDWIARESEYGRDSELSGLQTKPHVFEKFVESVLVARRQGIINLGRFSWVVSPSVGGIVFGQRVAAHLRKRFIIFEIHRNDVRNEHLYKTALHKMKYLIVDDVVHSGATVNNMEQTLTKKYRMQCVGCLALTQYMALGRFSLPIIQAHP